MLSTEHEILNDLSRGRPEFVGELLRDMFGPTAAPTGVPLVRSADVTQSTPVELRADQVIVYTDPSDSNPGSRSDSNDAENGQQDGGAATAAVVVEVQRERDEDKLFSWPSYVVLARARHRCPTSLLVVCTKSDVARWAERPIQVNQEGFELTANVIGPENTPYVTDADQARSSPELAVLSAIMHGNEECRGKDVIAALVAGLDHTAGRSEGKLAERHRRYLIGVEACLPTNARRMMMAIMQEEEYGFRNVFERFRAEGLAEGLAEGQAEGQAEGRAEAVLQVLRVRGLDVPDEVRDGVLDCTDLGMLDQLLTRAIGVTNAKELFD